MSKPVFNIEEYIKNSKEEARPFLSEIFNYISETYPYLTPQLLYSLPGYKLNNNYLIIGANKSYLSIHTRDFDAVKNSDIYFKNISKGKGCIRIKYSQKENLLPLKKYIDNIILKSEKENKVSK